MSIRHCIRELLTLYRCFAALVGVEALQHIRTSGAHLSLSVETILKVFQEYVSQFFQRVYQLITFHISIRIFIGPVSLILGSLRIDDFRTTAPLGHLKVPRRRPVEICINDSL